MPQNVPRFENVSDIWVFMDTFLKSDSVESNYFYDLCQEEALLKSIGLCVGFLSRYFVCNHLCLFQHSLCRQHLHVGRIAEPP